MLHADPQALLTLDDMAELCQTGTDWIRKLVQARKVEHTRVAGQIRMTRDEFAAMIRDHAVPASEVPIPTRDEVSARRNRKAA